jgi:hypothetical protein
MPPSSLRTRAPRRLFGPQGRLPTWAQWGVPLGVAAVLVVALIVVVDHAQSTANQPAPVVKASAIAEQNREARILVAQDQAPHSFRISHPTPPARAVALAISAVMRAEVGTGVVAGPLQGTRCRPLGHGGLPGSLAFACTAEVGNVRYPFRGVVGAGSRRVTVCKQDLAPVPGMSVPLSRRCR